MGENTLNQVSPGASTAISNLPMQIKSLFISSLPAVISENFVNFDIPFDTEDVLVDPIKAIVYFLNFFSLMKIEYLHDFARTSHSLLSLESGIGAEFPGSQTTVARSRENSVKNPQWQQLTQGIFRGIVGGPGEIICRMRPYENSRFNVMALAGLKLPVYDTYFVIRNLDTPLRVETLASPSTGDPFDPFRRDNDVVPDVLETRTNSEVQGYIIFPEQTSTDPRDLEQLGPISGGTQTQSGDVLGPISGGTQTQSGEPRTGDDRSNRSDRVRQGFGRREY